MQDAYDIYRSFFRPSERTKVRDAARLIPWPATRGSSDPVFNRAADQEVHYWTSLPVGDHEEITYTRNGASEPNWCHHTFFRHGLPIQTLPTYSVERWTGPATIGGGEVVPRTETRVYGAWAPTTIRSLSYDHSEYNSAFANALSRVASEGFSSMMNVPQAIIELKDVPGTARDLSNLVRYGRGLLRSRGPRVLSRSTLRSVAKGYLADVFGIQPTAGDVSRFLEQVPKRLQLSGRVVDYYRGQKVRAHFRLGGKGLIPQYPSTSKIESALFFADIGSSVNMCPADWLGSANASTIANEGVTRSGLWPYGSQIGYRVEVLDCTCFGEVANTVTWNDAMSALDDVLANSPLPLTMWELLPFSFVVDWFADVSQWMKNANRIRWAHSMGLRLKDGVWKSERSCYETYYPFLNHSAQGTLVYSHQAGNRVYWNAFGSSTKKVTHQLVLTEGNFYRERYGELRLPPLSTKGVLDQGIFQAATSLALCLA